MDPIFSIFLGILNELNDNYNQMSMRHNDGKHYYVIRKYVMIAILNKLGYNQNTNDDKNIALNFTNKRNFVFNLNQLALNTNEKYTVTIKDWFYFESLYLKCQTENPNIFEHIKLIYLRNTNGTIKTIKFIYDNSYVYDEKSYDSRTISINKVGGNLKNKKSKNKKSKKSKTNKKTNKSYKSKNYYKNKKSKKSKKIN